ncbi:MAG: shikimate kinase [Candidatus Pelagibacter sp. TMED153]|nr:MAG: shikimate kinase [Candidatus Pelagibacter sp. TMED153]
MNKNLILTGMMGVGKSTVGEKLAKKMKLKFVDIDQIIELKEKATIGEIFKNRGENYFRKFEKKITLGELKKINLVIALGGGAFMNETIRKEVKDTSVSFWLDLNVKSLLPRLKNLKKRPLLNQNNLEKKMNKIYSERKKIYNESNFRIKCESLKIDDIVNKIIKLYESSRNKV